MMRFNFKKGMCFIDLKNRWVLIRRLVSGQLQFENEQGEIKNLADIEVLALWHSQQWLLDKESYHSVVDDIYHATPAEMANYPEKWQKEAERRFKYVDAVGRGEIKFNKLRWKQIIDAKAHELSDTKPPCPESVWAWVSRYQHTKSIKSLLPRTRTGKSRKQDERRKIFDDVIETTYLNRQKLPIKDVIERINRRITLLNSNRTPESRIKQIGESTIYRWVSELRQDIVDAARLGAKITRNKYRAVYKKLKVLSILERFEIDNTPLDLLVIDSILNLVLGRPWLTLIIDVKSRMIVGFYISFNTPSAYSVLQSLQQAILPKETLLANYPDIKNEWPAHGIPDLIALDNGMDFHSDALKKTCLELSIEILFCPAATPWNKPHIERVFKTLAKDLIHKIPGTTFSNIVDRGDYASENEAVIDMKTLTHLILKWIVDIYNVTPHRGLNGNTPLAVWKESAKDRIIELPAHPHELEVMLGIPAERHIFHYGIELDHLHYNAKRLQEIRKIAGYNIKVQLKYYEDQVATIDVFDPYQKEYFRVQATYDEYVVNLHRATHRKAVALGRKRDGEHFTKTQLMESRRAIEVIIEQAIQSKKIVDRKQAAGELGHDSASILKGDHLIKTKPEQKGNEPAPLIDSGLDDDLPDISSIDPDIDPEDLK